MGMFSGVGTIWQREESFGGVVVRLDGPSFALNPMYVPYLLPIFVFKKRLC